jgi:hypothetical protein
VGSHWKGDVQSNLLDGCFGLKEVLKDKEAYLESAYSLDLGYRIAYVEKDVFVKYVKNYLNLSSLGRSLVQTRTMIRNPEKKPSMGKAMNMKKVRIQSKAKKMQTEPVEAITSNFMFFKHQDLSASISPKYSKALPLSANLMFNKRKSQSIRSKTSSKYLL